MPNCLINVKNLKNDEIKKKKTNCIKYNGFEMKFVILNFLSKFATGFSEDKIFKSLTKNKSALESVVLSQKKDVRNFICTMVNMIIEKSPVKCHIVHNSSHPEPLS